MMYIAHTEGTCIFPDMRAKNEQYTMYLYCFIMHNKINIPKLNRIEGKSQSIAKKKTHTYFIIIDMP